MALKFKVAVLASLIVALTVLSACGGGSSSSSSLTAAQPGLTFDIKTFRFGWIDTDAATHYRLLENSDGVSGFSQVGANIPGSVQSYSHYVPLYARTAARYILQSCNDSACADSRELNIDNPMVNAIGYFKADNTDADDYFGFSVSFSDDGSTLAVGASRENAVYVFFRGNNNWSQQAYIQANNTETGDEFGYALSLSDDGNTLAVGARAEDSNSTGVDSTPNDDGNADVSGAAYIFTRTTGNWNQQAYIKASIIDSADFFGQSVSLSGDGDTLAVGAIGEDSSNSIIPSDDSASEAGAAYVFSRSGASWAQDAYIKAFNTGTEDRFGSAVAVSGDGNTLAVGASREDGLAIDSGAIYVFTFDGNNWPMQGYVKADNAGQNDMLGGNGSFRGSVSLSHDGNTLAVGARREDGSATGINGNDDNNALVAGAAYVFSRSGNNWTQQAYIKASNTEAGDLFGSSVSLSNSGDRLAVGASSEDSNSAGINSSPNDDGNANNSGAAYVYVRSASNWSQQAYIKAGNTGASDSFGDSISISGDGNSLAVGAPFESSNSTGINSTPNDDGSANSSGAVYLY